MHQVGRRRAYRRRARLLGGCGPCGLAPPDGAQLPPQLRRVPLQPPVPRLAHQDARHTGHCDEDYCQPNGPCTAARNAIPIRGRREKVAVRVGEARHLEHLEHLGHLGRQRPGPPTTRCWLPDIGSRCFDRDGRHEKARRRRTLLRIK
jgi:hypothetical protein